MKASISLTVLETDAKRVTTALKMASAIEDAQRSHLAPRTWNSTTPEKQRKDGWGLILSDIWLHDCAKHLCALHDTYTIIVTLLRMTKSPRRVRVLAG